MAGGSVAEVGGATSGYRTRCLDEALAHGHVHTLPERTAYWRGKEQEDFRLSGKFVFLNSHSVSSRSVQTFWLMEPHWVLKSDRGGHSGSLFLVKHLKMLPP